MTLEYQVSFLSGQLAYIRKYTDEVLAQRPDRIDTHYEMCWKDHGDCYAYLIKSVLDGSVEMA